MQLPSTLGNSSFGGQGCFAVNIKGDKIEETKPSTCDAGFGIFGGLVPLGGGIELEAPYGKNRTIEIYYVVSETGCEDFSPSQGMGKTFGANNVYRISQVQNVNFDKPEVRVEMQIDYPSEQNMLRTLLSLNSSCDRALSNINLMAVKQARAVLGAARALTDDSQAMMHVRVVDQAIQVKEPKDFNGKISPVRLGAE